MRIAAVEFEGSTRWVDAADATVCSLDLVSVRLANGDEVTGRITVTPEQWVQQPVEAEGVIVAVLPADEVPEEVALPGAELPPLGSIATVDGVTGIVTAIDPLQGTVVVEGDGELAAPNVSDPAL